MKHVCKMPPEVQATRVSVSAPFYITTTFTDGRVTKYNLAPLLNFGNFKKLNDATFLNKAHVAFGTVTWDDTLDIATVELYENGEQFGCAM